MSLIFFSEPERILILHVYIFDIVFYSKRVYFWGAKHVVPNNNFFRTQVRVLYIVHSAKIHFFARPLLWQKIADELASLSRPKFKVTLTKRSVQDRLLLIITKHKRRMATERRESGTSPEISELDKLLEDVVEKEKCYEQRRESEGKITWNQGGLLWKIYILP